jgi:hypothetical protein
MHSRLVGVGLPLCVIVGVWRVEDVRAAHILLFDRRRNSHTRDHHTPLFGCIFEMCSSIVKVAQLVTVTTEGVSSVATG